MKRLECVLVVSILFGTPVASYGEQSTVDDLRRAATSNSLLDIDTLASPGIEVGFTTYDLQHSTTQGHQIATLPGSNTVHMVWTYWDRIPVAANERDRFVRYNSWNVSGGFLNQGGNGQIISLASWARAGFTGMDVDSQGKAHVALHQYPEDGFCCYSCWHIFIAREGLAWHTDNALTPVDPDEIPGAEETNWPAICVNRNDPSGDTNVTDIYHVFGTVAIDFGFSTALPADILAYWRFDQDPVVNPTQRWADPVIVDSSETLDYECDAADDGTGKVALCFTNNTEPQFNDLLNLGYRESFTEGLGWLDGSELGDSLRTWITNYNDESTPGPQVLGHTSVAYDHASHLHITWIEQRIANVSVDDVRLLHWSDAHGQTSVVKDAYYHNLGTYEEIQNLSHATLGVGVGDSYCEDFQSTNEDFLYMVYSQNCGPTSEERGDTSVQGICNSELYLIASTDQGLSWSYPQNLTNTRTPLCNPQSDPDSVCASEAWASIARDVSDINIFYILDREAGDFSETGWVYNSAMYLNYPAGTDAQYVCPLASPRIVTALTSDPACEYHAPNGGLVEEALTIENLGNRPMTGSILVTGGQFFLSTVPSGPYTITNGDPPLEVTVTMDADGLPDGLYYGAIEITHNDVVQPNPTVIPIEFFVSNDFHCPEETILKTGVAGTGVLSLEVGTDGRFGYMDAHGGLWREVHQKPNMGEATVLVAHEYQATDTVVYHRLWNHLPPWDPGQFGIRSLGPIELDTSHYGIGSGAAFATAHMTTADSLLGIDATWYFPQHPDSADFVVVRYVLTNRTNEPGYTPFTLVHIVFGVLIDFDALQSPYIKYNIQKVRDNWGAYWPDSNLVYQFGRRVTSYPHAYIDKPERFSAGVTYIAGRDVNGYPFAFENATLRADVRSALEIRNEPGVRSGSLYQSLVGPAQVPIYEAPQSSGYEGLADLYTILTLDQNLTLGPGVSQEYIIGLLSDTLQHFEFGPAPGEPPEEGLHHTLQKAWTWAEQNLSCFCPWHGNPYPDGILDVLDVVLTVDVAFRNGVAPASYGCPYTDTDVTCDNVTDVFDVVAMVDVTFRSGDPETAFCDPCEL